TVSRCEQSSTRFGELRGALLGSQIQRPAASQQQRGPFRLVGRAELERRPEIRLRLQQGVQRHRPVAGITKRRPNAIDKLPVVLTGRTRELERVDVMVR